MKITELQPQLVWHYFDAITKIPRASYNEQPMTEFLFTEVKKLGYEPEIDHVFNVFFRVPATKGLENIPIVLLQAHHDMVTVKTNESIHDFTKHPIQTIISDSGWLYAKDTSLGADNGIGIAIILAILSDKTIPHGPLEILFTSNEEVGLIGAEGFDINKLNCKYVINVDHENDSEIGIGCLCCTVLKGTVPFKRDNTITPGTGNLKITLNGGLGGHSGALIHQKRINAIKEIFNLVYILNEKHDLRIVEVCKAGLMSNVIPSHASIIINLPKEDIDFSKYLQDLKEAYPLEANLTLTSEWINTDQEPMTKADSDKVLHTFNGVFNGLSIYNLEYNVGESSSNLGTIETTKNTVSCAFMIRGAYDLVSKHLTHSLISSFKSVGGEASITTSASGWTPKPNPLAISYGIFFEELTHKKVKTILIPGGVEIATILSKKPEMLCLCIGPTIEEVHSTNERVNIESVQFFYNVLCKFLPAIK